MATATVSAAQRGLEEARTLLTALREAEQAVHAHCEDDRASTSDASVIAWNATYDELHKRENLARLRFVAHVAWMLDHDHLVARRGRDA